MPRPYPPEFRARAIALVREGRQVKQTALDLGAYPRFVDTGVVYAASASLSV